MMVAFPRLKNRLPLAATHGPIETTSRPACRRRHSWPNAASVVFTFVLPGLLAIAALGFNQTVANPIEATERSSPAATVAPSSPSPESIARAQALRHRHFSAQAREMGLRELWQITPQPPNLEGWAGLMHHPGTNLLITTRGHHIQAFSLQNGRLQWQSALPSESFHIHLRNSNESILAQDVARFDGRLRLYTIHPTHGRPASVKLPDTLLPRLLTEFNTDIIARSTQERSSHLGRFAVPSGERQWSLALPRNIDARFPAVTLAAPLFDGRAPTLIAADPQRLMLIDLSDGKLIHDHALTPPKLHQPQIPGRLRSQLLGGPTMQAAASPDTLILATESIVRRIQPDSGTVQWTAKLPDPPMLTGVPTEDVVPDDPDRPDHRDQPGQVPANTPDPIPIFDLWRPPAFALLIDSDRRQVYLSRNDRVAALNLDDGRIAWSLPIAALLPPPDPRQTETYTDDNPHRSHHVHPPLLYGSWLLIPLDRIVVALDPTDGSEQWRLTWPGPLIDAPPVLIGSQLAGICRNLNSPNLTGRLRLAVFSLPTPPEDSALQSPGEERIP